MDSFDKYPIISALTSQFRSACSFTPVRFLPVFITVRNPSTLSTPLLGSVCAPQPVGMYRRDRNWNSVRWRFQFNPSIQFLQSFFGCITPAISIMIRIRLIFVQYGSAVVYLSRARGRQLLTPSTPTSSWSRSLLQSAGLCGVELVLELDAGETIS